MAGARAMKRTKQSLTVIVADNYDILSRERRIIVTGRRYIQALKALVDAGPRGVTALEMSSWALRLGHYIFILRRTHGLLIETLREDHDGGTHARYRLISDVNIVETDELAA